VWTSIALTFACGVLPAAAAAATAAKELGVKNRTLRRLTRELKLTTIDLPGPGGANLRYWYLAKIREVRKQRDAIAANPTDADGYSLDDFAALANLSPRTLQSEPKRKRMGLRVAWRTAMVGAASGSKRRMRVCVITRASGDAYLKRRDEQKATLTESEAFAAVNKGRKPKQRIDRHTLNNLARDGVLGATHDGPQGGWRYPPTAIPKVREAYDRAEGNTHIAKMRKALAILRGRPAIPAGKMTRRQAAAALKMSVAGVLKLRREGILTGTKSDAIPGVSMRPFHSLDAAPVLALADLIRNHGQRKALALVRSGEAKLNATPATNGQAATKPKGGRPRNPVVAEMREYCYEQRVRRKKWSQIANRVRSTSRFKRPEFTEQDASTEARRHAEMHDPPLPWPIKSS
jgi:hypothetical protein